MSVMLQSWSRTIQILVGRADRKTAEQLWLAQQELRQEEEELQPERKGPALERNIPAGQPQVKEALIRDLLHRCERQTETRSARSRMRFLETPIGFDGRGHLQVSVGIFERKNDPPNPVLNVGTRRGMASARVRHR